MDIPPGHESRQGEVVAVRETLEKVPGLAVTVMEEPARMDGGDVLFTGLEFFVGLSNRTNQVSVRYYTSYIVYSNTHWYTVLYTPEAR